MLPELTEKDRTEEILQVIIDEGVPVVETSGRSPEPFVKRLKTAGIKLIHKVPSVRFAQKAELSGRTPSPLLDSNVEVIRGWRMSPPWSSSRVLPMPLLYPSLQGEALPTPGGFWLPRLGAEGVVMGTRFVPTHECPAHPRIKDWFVQAKETDTLMIQRFIRNAERVIKNRAAEKVAGHGTGVSLPAGTDGRDQWRSGQEGPC